MPKYDFFTQQNLFASCKDARQQLGEKANDAMSSLATNTVDS